VRYRNIWLRKLWGDARDARSAPRRRGDPRRDDEGSARRRAGAHGVRWWVWAAAAAARGLTTLTTAEPCGSAVRRPSQSLPRPFSAACRGLAWGLC